MSLQDYLQKIKNFFTESEVREKALTAVVILLVGTASFGLGRISAIEDRKEPVKIENLPLQAHISSAFADNKQNSSNENSQNGESYLKEGGFLIASKSGGKYHFPWCSGAKRILEENKVYFLSVEEARTAGYEPAANCKGLE